MRFLPLIITALLLGACAGAPAPPQSGAAAQAVAPAAPNPAPPTGAPAPTGAPTQEPTAPPPPTAPPATATAAPTTAASPTPPLFFEPTAAPGQAPAPTEVLQAAAPQPPPAAPAQAGGAPVRLVIDAIGLDRPLVPVGLDPNRIPVVPDHDVGWYTLGATPGQGENVVLWGHVLRFRHAPEIPAPFARLRDLKPGDGVTLFDAQGTPHAYVVTEQVWARPNQVEYMLPVGRERVTLISCIGDKVIAEGTVEMTHRLITIAEPAR